jgi:hypothetical protein
MINRIKNLCVEYRCVLFNTGVALFNLLAALIPSNPIAWVSWICVGASAHMIVNWFTIRHQAANEEDTWNADEVNKIITGCLTEFVRHLKSEGILPPEFQLRFQMEEVDRPPDSKLH